MGEQLLEPLHLVLGIVGHQHRDLRQSVVHAVVEYIEENRANQCQVESTFSIDNTSTKLSFLKTFVAKSFNLISDQFNYIFLYIIKCLS